MSFLQFYCKTVVVFSFLFINILLILADDTHSVEKRQIGVLARTGALPQGKRSVEVLARNGELPHSGGKKDISIEDAKDLIEEVVRAESLSKLHAQALAEKIVEEAGFDGFGADKRSVAALARNGELPQKRMSEAVRRSGYLIRPLQETVQPPSDLLNPDDFLANGRTSLIPGLSDERNFKSKRNLGSARNFLVDPGINFYHKKNLASLARDGGFEILRHPLIREQNGVGAFGLTDLHEDNKKNIGASTRFGRRVILDKLWNKYPSFGAVDIIGKFGADPDYEDILPDFGSERNRIKKRFLGRIPQLGRVQQKVQTPSARRRPHLRPNWL